MPIATGQITIIDFNDARPITVALTANRGLQQVYSQDSVTLFEPSWFSPPNVIMPIISIGGLTQNEAWSNITNRAFSLTSGGAALTTGSTSAAFVNDSDGQLDTPFTVTLNSGSTSPPQISIAGNLKASAAAFTLYFTADFNDPTTGLTTSISSFLTLNSVRTGTNAVFINIRGQVAFSESFTETQNVLAVAADLIRAGTIVASNTLTYRWFQSFGATKINTALADVNTKYGFKDTATGTAPTGILAELGVNIPVTTAGNALNTMVLGETAVVDIGVYRVEITDDEANVYSAYFTIWDISDPYDLTILSSAGDKLPNGVGSTQLTPLLHYGSTEVTPLTGWTFVWYFFNRTGYRGGFVDVDKISASGGAPISEHTTGATATITYTGTSYAFTVGMLLKAVRPNGIESFYEVGSSTTNVVTLRAPTTNTWLSTNFPAPTGSEFEGGRLFGCTGTGSGAPASNGTRTTSAGTAFTVTGDDIDVKARILAEAFHP